MNESAAPRRRNEKPAQRIEDRISIDGNGVVTIRSGKVEYGQGIRLGFARIVAEELCLDPEAVRVVLGETDCVPWDMGTFGSMSTAVDGAIIREAAACTRDILLARAAAALAEPAGDLSLRNGRVVARGGKSIAFAELARRAPISGEIPDVGVTAHAPLDGTLSGVPPGQAMLESASPARSEARAILTGEARYPADIRLPDMLRARVIHPPVHGSRLVRVHDRAARHLPGIVRIFRNDDFAAVIAETDEQARMAAARLEVNWTTPAIETVVLAEARLRQDDAVDEKLAFGTHRRLRAAYHIPHIAHASIGPSAAVADVRRDSADLYVATQRPFALRDEVAELLGMDASRIHVHPQMMSGLYGRGNVSDAALEAALLSKAAGRPVLVQWSREQEFARSPHRPELSQAIEAAVDGAGMIAAWRSEVTTNPHTYGGGLTSPAVLEMTSGRNAVPPYRIGAAEVSLRVMRGPVRTGAFRSLAAAPNVFAIESFMDELARASGQDPVDFRLRHIEDRRLARVVARVREMSGWRAGGAPGRGLGMACAIYHGTYIAQVAEVVLADQDIRVSRVWCACDGGRLVHPDGARNQIEGGIQQALSWAMHERLEQQDGTIKSLTWHDYPIATFANAPDAIEVAFVAESAIPSSGMGEPGSVPTAAAVANAIANGGGPRIRQLPLARQMPPRS